jgi:hypothetical protein
MYLIGQHSIRQLATVVRLQLERSYIQVLEELVIHLFIFLTVITQMVQHIGSSKMVVRQMLVLCV